MKDRLSAREEVERATKQNNIAFYSKYTHFSARTSPLVLLTLLACVFSI